mmetsp:Transcript_58861/g.138385  ORF Transcript_58861/g.138385 Transcript_58861/m.138385 type:complete len:333 (-) Transcript_58861:192-1190(-)
MMFDTPSAVKSRPIGEMSPLPVFSFRSQILTSPGNGFLAARPVARIDGNTGCQSTAYTAVSSLIRSMHAFGRRKSQIWMFPPSLVSSPTAIIVGARGQTRKSRGLPLTCADIWSRCFPRMSQPEMVPSSEALRSICSLPCSGVQATRQTGRSESLRCHSSFSRWFRFQSARFPPPGADAALATTSGVVGCHRTSLMSLPLCARDTARTLEPSDIWPPLGVRRSMLMIESVPHPPVTACCPSGDWLMATSPPPSTSNSTCEFSQVLTAELAAWRAVHSGPSYARLPSELPLGDGPEEDPTLPQLLMREWTDRLDCMGRGTATACGCELCHFDC